MPGIIKLLQCPLLLQDAKPDCAVIVAPIIPSNANFQTMSHVALHLVIAHLIIVPRDTAPCHCSLDYIRSPLPSAAEWHVSPYLLCVKGSSLATSKWRMRHSRVGQNRIYALYMTVYLVIPSPKLPFIHCVNLVMANPINASLLSAKALKQCSILPFLDRHTHIHACTHTHKHERCCTCLPAYCV